MLILAAENLHTKYIEEKFSITLINNQLLKFINRK